MQNNEDLQYLVKVDNEDKEIGKVERWEAHEKNILHRALTIVLFFKDKVILTHRKHPVFDSVFDLTISTHQYFDGANLVEGKTLAMRNLKREMNLKEVDLLEEPHGIGKIFYQAKDVNSKYFEHEICHIMKCSVKNMKLPNLDFSYGFTLEDPKSISKSDHYLYPKLAPWVREMLSKNII